MKSKQVVLQIPTVSIDFSFYLKRVINYINYFFRIIKQKIANIYLSVHKFIGRKTEQGFPGEEVQPRVRFRALRRYKKIFKNVIIAFIALIILVVAVKMINGEKSDERIADNRMEVKDAIFVTDVNKEFNFPLKDLSGEEVSKIKYMIEKTELTDEIITEGKRATAVKGRIFLILVLKITNQYEKPIEINTRDYVRLSVNGNEKELLAPDTHNDPVEIQAISTKYTRVGFIINDSDKDHTLYVGEIQGDKEKIRLDFK